MAAVLMLIPVTSFPQAKPTIVVKPFTTAKDVEVPYDLKTLQAQVVAELKVMIGKQFAISAEAPAAADGKVYTLETEITAWQAGNAAKRMFVGFGSGRESADIEYRLTDESGRKVLSRKDTVRTNYFAQNSGSSGTLGHPFAEKIGEHIEDADLK